MINLSAPFIDRPVATTLLTFGVALAGAIAFRLLPVSPLPQVDYPTISVQASLPGASPETMAATVATPLERSLGRIADITEMTSSSSLGSTRITLQFDLSRDIDGAARDVQAAINAARNLLPSGLPSNPTYRKVNPADAPIMILALTSATMTQGQMYDAASTIIAQKLSQVSGVGQVSVGGSSLPAVRVELNPAALNKYGVGFEQVRAALAAANANRPKGAVEDGDRHWQIYANDQAKTAAEYLPLIVSYQNGAAIQLSDVATVVDSVQDLRNAGMANGKPSVLVIIYRQPNANIIETVDRVCALLPSLRASIPNTIDLRLAMERTTTIRASLRDTERSLTIAVVLVILVVFLFLRNGRATLIPSVAVPVSLIGTFGVMYLFGFSVNNFTLMALTIATGFVVDDAIVVLENTSRHIEAGMEPFAAALRGAGEVGFTVLSMSLSLIAVFIPILLMGGIVGRLFREFAITLSVAILVSLAVSLTTTPMMCARLLRPKAERRTGRVGAWSERVFAMLVDGYKRSLAWNLRHGVVVMLVLLATVILNGLLYYYIPKGFFPQQDTGRLTGSIQADQSISFQAMRVKLADFMRIVGEDPAVQNVVGFTGGAQRNSGFMFVALKPLTERKETVDQVIARLRVKLAKEPGANLFLQPVQDIRIGGRASNAQYQYTLQGDDLAELRAWEPKIRAALSQLPELTDVNTDAQDKGLQTSLVIDRDAAARLGVTPSMIDATLNDLFGQRQVSTIYAQLNQYHVVMEASPEYWQAPGYAEERLREHAGRRPGAAVRLRHLCSDQHAAGRQPPGAVRRVDDLLQPAAERVALPGDARNRRRDAQARRPQFRARHLPGQRARVPVVPQQPAVADPRRHPDRLHRAGRALRELRASDHDPVDASLRRRRRAARAEAVQHRVHDHRVHRRHPAHRHREEERDHDDRLRPRRGTLARALHARRDLRGLPAALSPDHDDHDGGDAGRAAARAGRRRWRRDAAPAGNRDRRRAPFQSIADALYDAGRVPLSRPVPAVGSARARSPCASGDASGRSQVKRTRPEMTRIEFASRTPRSICVLAAGAILAGCMAGPDYVRPTAPTSAAFKEAQGWKVAQPSDGAPKGPWWEAFADPDLDRLVSEVNVSNQSVQAAAARVREAQAATAAARTGLFPAINLNATALRTSRAGTTTSSSTSSTTTTTQSITNSYNVALDLSWEIDLWGRIRRGIEASETSAQASAADLAAAQLSMQALLAQDYLTLRVVDAEIALLHDTVAGYERSLTLTRNQYAAGIVGRGDVAQAEAQLASTQAQEQDATIQRAQLEHAIAVLTGKPPSELAIASKPLVAVFPQTPVSVPSELLERRPDIAAAERRTASANAEIGVAQAAFYPALSLGATGGVQSSAIGNLLSLPSRYWSIGPSIAQAIFDAGLRQAQKEQAIAAYDETVANYRNTVLTGFQEVEDNLAALSILERETVLQDAAVKAARESATIANNQYKAGTTTYLTVVVLQSAALSSERTALGILARRLTASVGLIKALGGGWNATALAQAAP